MPTIFSPLTVVVALLAFAVSACAPLKQYRTSLELCESARPDVECAENALQRYRDPEHQDKEYLLGFIEFDDQGQLFDRGQMRAVLDELFVEASSDDLLITVFVHGWKHSAAPGDNNITAFRRSLEQLSALESAVYGAGTGPKERKVVGVYLGWRGGSVTAPFIEELSFWNRKKTAHKVGHGSVTEVVNRLDLLRQTKDYVVREDHYARLEGANEEIDRTLPPPRSRTRLVVVGHSFGGAVVYAALSQILVSRFVHTTGPVGQVSNPEGFGDLVVLINPAFEALRFTPLSDMSTERGTYFETQLPVMAVLTSEADDATRVAFPLGRSFSTMFEKDREMSRRNGLTRETENIDEGAANTTAVGHFDPYTTHYLRAAEGTTSDPGTALSTQEAVQTFATVSEGWENDAPGSRILFDGSVLERNDTSAGRNPYLVVRVDEALIKDHNDIYDWRVASFIRQLILISSQSRDLGERQLTRQQAVQAPLQVTPLKGDRPEWH